MVMYPDVFCNFNIYLWRQKFGCSCSTSVEQSPTSFSPNFTLPVTTPHDMLYSLWILALVQVTSYNNRTNRLGWHKPKLRGHLTNKTKIHAVASVGEASWEELGLDPTRESWQRAGWTNVRRQCSSLVQWHMSCVSGSMARNARHD